MGLAGRLHSEFTGSSFANSANPGKGPAVQIGRRAFLKQTLAAGAFFGAGSVVYARGYEPYDLELTRVPLHVGLDRPDGSPLRVGFISDIHFDPHYETGYLAGAFRRLAAERPHLVLYGGDFVSHTTARFDEFGAIAAGLRPPLGSYAALGNHDFWSDPKRVQAILERSGVQVLRNQVAPLPGHPGWFLSGLDSFWGGRPDPTIFTRHAGDARFLSIVHEPDPWNRLRDPRIRLQVSGHTHGGQVRAPFYGALQLPRLGKLYDAGLFRRDGDQFLYMNRGLGTVNLPVRVNCRPEITLFALT
jgi:predicted MPP superfamily phosphohydrolase